MEHNSYSEAIQYEQLTQSIYQAILQNELSNNIQVKHNVEVKGRSGVKHQIDVLWRFKQAGVEHMVLIECKNYATNLTLEKVRNFFGVLHDIGNAQGIRLKRGDGSRVSFIDTTRVSVGIVTLAIINKLEKMAR